MFGLIVRLLTGDFGAPPTAKAPLARRRRRMGVEALEHRQVLSSVAGPLSGAAGAPTLDSLPVEVSQRDAPVFAIGSENCSAIPSDARAFRATPHNGPAVSMLSGSDAATHDAVFALNELNAEGEEYNYSPPDITDFYGYEDQADVWNFFGTATDDKEVEGMRVDYYFEGNWEGYTCVLADGTFSFGLYIPATSGFVEVIATDSDGLSSEPRWFFVDSTMY